MCVFSNTPFCVCKRFVPASIAQWLWFLFLESFGYSFHGISWKRKVGMSELHCISWRKFKKVWLALPVGGSSALLACLQCMRLGRHVVSCDILQWLSQVVSVQPNAVCSDHPYHCGVAQHPCWNTPGRHWVYPVIFEQPFRRCGHVHQRWSQLQSSSVVAALVMAKVCHQRHGLIFHWFMCQSGSLKNWYYAWCVNVDHAVALVNPACDVSGQPVYVKTEANRSREQSGLHSIHLAPEAEQLGEITAIGS